MTYSKVVKNVVKPLTKVTNITSEDYLNAGYTLISRNPTTK